MPLNRTIAGLLFSESFSSLAGWTVPAEWSVDASQPIYLAYPTDVTVLAGEAIGGADGSGPREGHLMVVSDALWYLFYGAGDGNNTGTGAPWRPQLAKSTDRGLTWTKLGSITGITNGSYAARDLGGYVWFEGGNYYLHVLNADANTNGVPAINYRAAIYTATDPEGTWTFVRETPSLGASGSFDEVTVCVGWTENIGGTYHHYYSARTLSESADPGWTIGHGTSSSPSGDITKDGGGNFISSAVTGTARCRAENPKKWYSSVLGKHVIATNSVGTAGCTDGNDIIYSASQLDFKTSVYRSRAQSNQWSGFDGINAVGLMSPYCNQDGSIVEVNGYVPFTWDADPPTTFNSASNSPSYHRGRKIRQGVLEPAATAAKMTAAASPKLLVKAVAHTNFTAEFALELSSTASSASAGFAYRMSANNGDTFNGYLVLVDVANNIIRLFKNTGGSYTSIGSYARSTVKSADAVNLTVERWKIVVSGSNHKLYLNGSTTPAINVTDATYASGSYCAFRGECAAKVRLFSMRAASDVVTVNGLTQGDAVVLRGHGGVIAATATADAGGSATLTAKHFPLKSISVNGADSTPADGGLIWGGDTLSFGTSAAALAGDAAAHAAAAGTLTSIAAALQGVALIVATASGQLTTNITLAGAAVSIAAASGALSSGSGLAGAAAAQAGASGALTAQIKLSGVALAQAVVAGGLTTQVLLAGGVSAQAIAQAGLSTQIPLGGNASAQATAQAALTVQTLLQGAAAAQASAAGSLNGTPATLAGNAAAQASVLASLSTVIRLSGDVAAQANVAGQLTTRIDLSGAAIAQAIVTGAFSMPIQLQGHAGAQSDASGYLDGTVATHRFLFAKSSSARLTAQVSQ